MSRWCFATLVLAAACGGSSVMKPEDLASEMRQLRSLDAEALLLEEVVAAHHHKGRFTLEHAVYLEHSAREHTQKLAHAIAEPGNEAELERVRGAATRLEDRFVALVLEMQ